MTILNVWVSPSRALVSVDTIAGSARDLSPIPTTKMMPFAHASLIVAGAGNIGLMQNVYWRLAERQDGQLVDYDYAAALVPTLIDSLWQDMNRQAASLGIPARAFSPFQSVVLVGWSRARGRMCGQYQSLHPGETLFRRPSQVVPYLLHPNAFNDAKVAAPNTANKMLTVAGQQLRWWRANTTVPTGGELVTAEMTRSALKVSRTELPR